MQLKTVKHNNSKISLSEKHLLQTKSHYFLLNKKNKWQNWAIHTQLKLIVNFNLLLFLKCEKYLKLHKICYYKIQFNGTISNIFTICIRKP